MTVSLSSAESHFSFKFPVVPHGLFPPWSMSGVGVQLFHQHDKCFRKLPYCSLTNHKHTRMLSTSIFHPVVCICLHLWFSPRGQGMQHGGGVAECGEAGHWGGKAVRVGIRLSFCLSRLNEIDLLRCFSFCRVFLRTHQRTAEPYNPHLHFCNLHELSGARRPLTVVRACTCVCTACVFARAHHHLKSKIRTRTIK